LKRLLPFLGKDFVPIPVLFPTFPSDLPHGRKFHAAVPAAGAVEVIHGTVLQSTLKAAIEAEVLASHLPADARKLLPYINVTCVLLNLTPGSRE
jgi:hypothetical protein